MSRRARRRWIAASLVASATLGATRGEAAPLRASLEVRRGAGAQTCVDGVELSRLVEELAEAPILSGDEPRVVALVVAIERTTAGHVATITISGERSGERVLESGGSSCMPLAQALAVSIAILLDAGPGAIPDPQPPPPPPPPPPPEPPQPPLPRARSRDYFELPAIDRPAAPSPDRARHAAPLAASVGTFYDADTLDGGSAGVAISLDVYLPWSSVAASFATVPRDEHQLPSQTLVYQLFSARVRGCFEPLEGSLGIALCSGLVAGQRTASVSGIGVEESSTDGAYAAATFELELSGTFYGPLGAYTGLGLAAPFVQGEIPLALKNAGVAESPRADVTFQLSTGLRVWIDP